MFGPPGAFSVLPRGPVVSVGAVLGSSWELLVTFLCQFGRFCVFCCVFEKLTFSFGFRIVGLQLGSAGVDLFV